MRRFLKRLFSRKAAPAGEPDHDIVRFDEEGFTRSSALIRAMGWRSTWRWDEIQEFGFRFEQAIFPDPWIGDYMESEWFVRVPCESGLETLAFSGAQLDVNDLPPVISKHLPGLDLQVLRDGVAQARGGYHHYEGEGEWVGWRRGASAREMSCPDSAADRAPPGS